MNANATTGYKFGVALGCAVNGVTLSDVMAKSAKVNECLASPIIQHTLAKIASTIFANAGREFAPEAAFYTAMSARPAPYTSFVKRAYLEPVLETLAHSTETLEKSASPSLFKFSVGDLIDNTGKVISGSQELLYKLALLGALGGAGLGTAGWLVNRDMQSDDAEATAKLEQAKHYRQIAKDLQKRLDANADASVERNNLRRAIQEENESAIVL